MPVAVLFWDRVVAAGRPRVATDQPFQSHPETFKNAPFLNRLHHVLRTSWVVTARRWREWRNAFLIKLDWQDEQVFEKLSHWKQTSLTPV